jgi:hypothetical protein
MNFKSAWLDLREPYDEAARDPEIAIRIGDWSATRSHLNVVDLGAGTGANLRWLAPRLRCAQSWTLIELDQDLIADGMSRLMPDVEWSYRPLDLARDLETAIPPDTDLVTTSALLDLVSDEWLDRLLQLLAARKLPFYAALTFNGEIELHPPVDGDAEVIALFNEHQRHDKGFGPALGGAAIDRLSRAIDFLVLPAPSEWVLGPKDGPMIDAFVTGLAEAAIEVDPAQERRISIWLSERRGLAARGIGGAFVGHDDLFVADGIRLKALS